MLIFKFYLDLLLISTHSVLGQSEGENKKPIFWHDVPD